MTGRVFLVGAGVGGKDLLVGRAIRAISEADVIIYDRLIDHSILELARPGAELIYMGKKPEANPEIQNDIIEIMIRKAREGRTVVRLKGGDPFIFGRGGEELLALRRAGIQVEAIPGLSSAIAIPTLAGLPLTLRHISSAVLIMTGHRAEPEDELSLSKCAKFEGTIVLLMARRNFGRIADLLMKGGMPSGRAAAALFAKGGGMRVILGTVGNLADKLRNESEPAVIVIGDVVKESLYRKVLITSIAPLDGRRFNDSGLLPINAPVIEIIPIHEGVVSFMSDLKEGRINSVAFLSPRAVQVLNPDSEALRILSGLLVFAVGPATRASLEAMRIPVTAIPEEYCSASLLTTLLSMKERLGTLAILRSGLADDSLSAALADAGIPHRQYKIYECRASSAGLERFFSALDEDLYAVAFTSRSSIKYVVDESKRRGNLPYLISRLSKIRVVCMGPESAKVAEELGISAEVPDVYTIGGILSKLEEGLK